jgi:hypothetical protein
MKEITEMIIETLKDAKVIKEKKVEYGTKTDPYNVWKGDFDFGLLTFDTSEKVIKKVIDEYMPFFNK